MIDKMKNVIHIYGAAGSGTTTLGKKISEVLGYKFMDTDDYFGYLQVRLIPCDERSQSVWK